MNTITTAIEPFGTVFQEIQALVPLHWREVALYQDDYPLKLNVQQYARLNMAGALVIFTARNDRGRLVGYHLTIRAPHLHYDLMTSASDMYWLHPDYRQGMNGVKLFTPWIRHCLHTGIHVLETAHKRHVPFDVGRLFRLLRAKNRQGQTVHFAHTENHYQLNLGVAA